MSDISTTSDDFSIISEQSPPALEALLRREPEELELTECPVIGITMQPMMPNCYKG